MLPSIKTEAQYSKAKFYQSDGTGRDNYIIVDNGGLTKGMNFFKQPPNVGFRQKSSHKTYLPASHVKTTHYISDGSGRDKYVIDNHGGLMNTQNQNYWLHQFKSSLRSPDTSRPNSGCVLPSYQSQCVNARRLAKPRNPTVTFEKRVKEEIEKQCNQYQLTQKEIIKKAQQH